MSRPTVLRSSAPWWVYVRDSRDRWTRIVVETGGNANKRIEWELSEKNDAEEEENE